MAGLLWFLGVVRNGFSVERPISEQDSSIECDGMGVTIELQNLGDAQLCRDIATALEHVFSGRQGEWRVSMAGSRAAENWGLRVAGPNGFERSYTLSAGVGEHELQQSGRLF